jgi:hypothetical protein
VAMEMPQRHVGHDRNSWSAVRSLRRHKSVLASKIEPRITRESETKS